MKTMIRNAMVIAGICGAASTFASDQIEVPVSYYTVALETKAGRLDVYHQLKSAAKQVCGPTEVRKAGSLRMALKNRACVDKTLTRSVEKISNTSLTAMHQAAIKRDDVS